MTPVKPGILKQLLEETQYDPEKTKFLIDGFTEGFDLGYRGPEDVKMTSPNLKFVIGDSTLLWNKVMQEVRVGRYAGPFDEIPFDNYIQSPIGLVPKDGGTKTRLIFHLSYPKDAQTSVNANTPEDLSSVSYADFEEAVRICLKEGKGCFAAKSDFSSALRHLCLARKFWKYLVMKARHPVTGVWYYFVDKCMPFGASISCANFQKFSDALSHIVKTKTGKENVNYLDDFFFVALLRYICNNQVRVFLDICKMINFPVSLEKTFWGTTRIIFLGLLIDTVKQIVCLPLDKVERALNLVNYVLNKRPRKIKLGILQELCGFLNFICKAIVPGRAFTRRLYAYGNHLTKKHHHLPVSREMRLDLETWLVFLQTPLIYNRPFLDLSNEVWAIDIDLATDASGNPHLGMGGTYRDRWFIQQWNHKFILKHKPSINYLELYAVTVAVFMWISEFQNQRVTLFCDNMSVVHMINSNTSSCKNCMVLIRLIVLESMTHNVRVTAKHLEGKSNIYPDLLSRLKYDQFWRTARANGKRFRGKTMQIPELLWPMQTLWIE